MSLPKEPRQLMINLMYLVLTAMLALNVSNEILHAFKVINSSIVKSNSSIESKNNETYLEFNANEQMEGKRERVHPYKVKADEVHAKADAMYTYLEGWKERIIEASGGREIPTDKKSPIRREDNIDATTDLLVEKNGGDTLKGKISQLREFLLGQLDATDPARKDIGDQMPLKIEQPGKTDNNPNGEWKVGFFEHMPTMAAVTLFSKFQNDVRNSEALIINQLFIEAHSSEIKFDAIKAIAIPKTSYALAGQKVEASIMIAAYNKTVSPTITSSSGHLEVKEGIGNWEGVASGVGMQTVKGTVSINLGDRTVTQPYDFQYMVGSTGASMQLDKMNVFYIGVPNPITVSAAGYSLEDVSINIPGATQAPGPVKGQYIITVDKVGEVMAAINAKTPTGVKQVGGMKIRVKNIPDPLPTVGGKSGGGMLASQFRIQIGLAAELRNFDFDTKFSIVSFDYSIGSKRAGYIGPFTVTGSHFDSNRDVKDFMTKLKPGDRVFLDNIKAVGPDKKVRPIPAISFVLN